jgi:hypothetical protein
MLPFTSDQFLDVFEVYHAAWPNAAPVLIILAVLAAILAVVRNSRVKPLPALILSLFWFWAGAAYHLAFFIAINPAAYIFGGMFIAQGVLVLIGALTGKGFSFEFRKDVRGIVGVILIVYALALYPLIGSLLGHTYPRAPSFGLPCPVTIFTFGLLLWDRAAIRWYVLAVPALWAFIGSTAAVFFGIWQDLGLPLALGAFTVVTLWRPLRPRFVPSA